MANHSGILITVVLLFAILPSVIILFGRRVIRFRRLRLLQDLQKACEKRAGGKGLELIPSFELVRYKYDHDAGSGRRNRGERSYNYALPVAFYALVCGLGLSCVFGFIGEPKSRSLLLLGRLDWLAATEPRLPEMEYQVRTLVALSFAFTGAYIWSILYLIRRIAIFDLSPLSFLRVTLHILFACFVCVALRHIVDPPYRSGAAGPVIAVLFVAAAFTVGFYPTLGVNYIINQFVPGKLKRYHPKATELSQNYPLDMIDGISAFTKFRLEELDVEDVQTLATRNPIMLFVETPYGLLEIFDWVSQAQLIMAAGPDNAALLRKMGISSLYALETFVSDDKGCALVGERLFGAGYDRSTCRRLVGIWAGALHVQRFRQVWNVLACTTHDVEAARPEARPHSNGAQALADLARAGGGGVDETAASPPPDKATNAKN